MSSAALEDLSKVGKSEHDGVTVMSSGYGFKWLQLTVISMVDGLIILLSNPNPNSLTPQDFSFTITNDKEKQQILHTFPSDYFI